MIAWATDERASVDLSRVLDSVLPRHPLTADIARAVEAALTGQPGRSVAATDRALWSAARALAVVGDGTSASAVLGVTSAWADWSETLNLATLPSPTARLLESGMVYAATLSVLGGGTLVTLDLRQLSSDSAGLELVYHPLAYRLVEACAPLWDGADGRGALVVYGLSRHAGTRSRGRRLEPAGRWLSRIFQACLSELAARRDWPQTPRLVLAD